MATRPETRRRQAQRASNEDRSQAAARNVDTGGVTISSNSGEAILRCERREISILVAREEITITEARYAAGEQVAGPHVHHEHTDAFYVLQGALTFEIGREAETITHSCVASATASRSSGTSQRSPPASACRQAKQSSAPAGRERAAIRNAGFRGFCRAL